jgi:hypothetical protein
MRLPQWKGIHALSDAAALVHLGAVILLTALTWGTALDALGVVFVVPVVTVVVVQIARRAYFGLTGRRLPPSSSLERPPDRLGRPDRERRPGDASGYPGA